MAKPKSKIELGLLRMIKSVLDLPGWLRFGLISSLFAWTLILIGSPGEVIRGLPRLGFWGYGICFPAALTISVIHTIFPGQDLIADQQGFLILANLYIIQYWFIVGALFGKWTKSSHYRVYLYIGVLFIHAIMAAWLLHRWA